MEAISNNLQSLTHVRAKERSVDSQLIRNTTKVALPALSLLAAANASQVTANPLLALATVVAAPASGVLAALAFPVAIGVTVVTLMYFLGRAKNWTPPKNWVPDDPDYD